MYNVNQPVPPPAAHPLPEGKELWKFLHSHNYIIQCHLQLCAPSQKTEQLHVCINYHIHCSYNYIIQCHLQLRTPSQKVSLTMEISPVLTHYILHHPVPPPAVHPIPEGEQLHVCRIITFTALTITSSSGHLQLCAPSQKVSNYMYV